ncbi:MAG: D-tyrosyl-tRNA(Tyr) deacylase [Lachnospiraceae bacterium]|nr:D-tyrosyl-tRNA(Tyr) deacylase [Lachnospiraceae bacterium]
MRAVIQRVSEASVVSDGVLTGQIGQGYLILLGVCASDTEAEARRLADKILKLRIFADAQGKTNLSILDVEGEFLVVSQFTLYADCRKGNRPSFTNAGPADHANALYEYFVSLLRESGRKVDTGVFGADMKVSLLNDGPFTIVLDTEELSR